jgi:SulP family sulfate permease
VDARDLPAGIELYEIEGPFFFGIADRLKDTLAGIERPPRVFILRLRKVPAIDGSGLHALEEFHTKCARHGTVLLLSGVQAQPRSAMRKAGLERIIGTENMFGEFTDALARARAIAAPPNDAGAVAGRGPGDPAGGDSDAPGTPVLDRSPRADGDSAHPT